MVGSLNGSELLEAVSDAFVELTDIMSASGKVMNFNQRCAAKIALWYRIDGMPNLGALWLNGSEIDDAPKVWDCLVDCANH